MKRGGSQEDVWVTVLKKKSSECKPLHKDMGDCKREEKSMHTHIDMQAQWGKEGGTFVSESVSGAQHT